MISMIKYNRLMEQINPAPDMEQRLHTALDQPVKRKPAVRHYAAPVIAACLVLVIGGTALLQHRAPVDREDNNVPPVANIGIQDYASTDDLAAALPFPLVLPASLPEGYTFSSAADQFGLAVVVYADADGNTLKYCMGTGKTALDGIYHEVSGTSLGTKDALLYQDSTFTSVEWSDAEYSYCFIAEKNLSLSEWTALVDSVGN